MKALTQQEIRFVKDTNFTPTVYQCADYSKTPFKDYDEAEKAAKEKYEVDLAEFLDKNLNQEDDDAISLEYVATYLFYEFFSCEELIDMASNNPKKGLEWLQDYRYFFGFRRWDLDMAVDEMWEAVEVYEGKRDFYVTEDGQVWNKEIEE